MKYEITDITHEEYPFLHRIRALRDVGDQVKAGDLGGFVESESNLATDPSDGAWIFDDAIAAGNAYVDMGSYLRKNAIACDNAYVSHGSVLSNHARAEDDAYLRGAVMNGSARVSGCARSSACRVSSERPCCLGTVRCTEACAGMSVLPAPPLFCQGKKS